ncbi:MAG TPA: replicative DNA helicase [Naasia sp.]|jgi:replicative DNA helicase
MPERTPPHDALAEQSVLGSMMISAPAVWDVLAILQGGDFYEPRHEEVFTAIVALTGRSLAVDAISVSDELVRRGVLEKVGGAAFVHTLTDVPTSPTAAGHHATIVRDHATARRLIAAGSRIVERGYEGTGDLADAVELARADVDRVAGRERVEVRPIGESFDAVMAHFEERPKMIPTPWPALNELLVGMQPGRLYVIGARPGEGKSMVGLQLAMELARRGPVAFSSLEMSREELLMRMLAARADVHMGSIERSHLSDEELERVARIRPVINTMPMYIDDRGDVTITQIRAFARSVGRKGPLAGVVVDYLQLISGASSDAKRYEIVSEVSRQLKVLAKDLGVPVIALSQLNREAAGQGKARRPPSLGDLRESGSIEQDADAVLLLQRDLEEDGRPGDKLRVQVAKNRHGKQGYRTLRWEGAYARVSSWNRWGLGELPIPD